MRAFELHRSANLVNPYYYQLYRPVNLTNATAATGQAADTPATKLAYLQREYPQAAKYASRNINSTEEQPKYLQDYRRSSQTLELDFRARQRYFKKLKENGRRVAKPDSLIAGRSVGAALKARTAKTRSTTHLPALNPANAEFFGIRQATRRTGQSKAWGRDLATPAEVVEASLTFGRSAHPTHVGESQIEMIDEYRPEQLAKLAYGPMAARKISRDRTVGVPDYYWQNTYPDIDTLRQLNAHIAASIPASGLKLPRAPVLGAGQLPRRAGEENSRNSGYRAAYVRKSHETARRSMTLLSNPLYLRRRRAHNYPSTPPMLDGGKAVFWGGGKATLAPTVEYRART